MTDLVPTAGTLAATFTPGPEADELLGILAWCSSAAGVAGVITVGMMMALQLRRGDPGEGGEHFRGLFFVMLACVLASTAGPIVNFLGPLSL
ncbi:hypothetical protein ACH492_28170 [Streptomyces sp. NPDC019443]|uniref:hypothetical protein n=1 Tax=Streptomyces sp. NPDC019443 TaxID=3365061 RepID=UPI0037995E29